MKKFYSRREFCKIAGISLGSILFLQSDGKELNQFSSLNPNDLSEAIQIGELTIPDPHVTNPEFFDLQKSDAPIVQFVNAMKMAGIVINPEEVVKNLQFKKFISRDNRHFVLACFEFSPSIQKQSEFLKGSVPLFIAKPIENDKWIWREAFLKELADPVIFHIGTGVGGFGFVQYYEQMIKTQTRGDFNLALLCVGPRWSEVYNSPPPKPIYYKDIDSDVSIAHHAGMDGYGHLVLWGAEAPQWFRLGKYSRQEAITIMQDSIKTDLQRYKGKIKYWNVVNEAYVSFGKGDAFLKLIGRDYVEIAFRTARETDPSAILLYNDYDNHTLLSKRSRQTKQIVEDLKKKGLIDMVGLETVLFYPDIPTKQQLIDGIREYGIPVMITEFVVNMAKFNGSKKAKYLNQAKIYFDVLSATIESGVCKDFVMFLAADAGNFWTDNPNHNLDKASPYNDPALFDRQFQPKPAYYASRMALFNYLRAS